LRSHLDWLVVPRPSWMPAFAQRLPQTEAAVAYAERLHAGQRQGDGTPYLLHPLEVASLLHDAGAPDHLIAAGALHDVLEKSHARTRSA
jgi:(p)ppGpp synthase/HD superfamily hydrolase